MTTPLNKTVKRKTLRPPSVVRAPHLVVAYEPGDMIAMKEANRRTWYRAPIERVFCVLAKWHAAETAREKSAERKLRRSLKAEGLV